MNGKELVKVMVKALDAKKAENIEIIKIADLPGNVLADYFVIASGSSSTHVKTLAEEAEHALSLLGVEPKGIEGRASGWILLDYRDVVLHVFNAESRAFYNLERLWEDGETIPMGELLD